MDTTLAEIAPDTFRLSPFHPDCGIQFTQFLVRDDEPFLMHTGLRRMFSTTRATVARVIDPAALRWTGSSHFGPDECGVLNDWLADGEVVALGRHRMRYLAPPHVPHGWDAGLYFDETERTLFCSDLFFQPGDPEPLVGAEIVDRAHGAVRAGSAGPLVGDLPYGAHTGRALADVLAAELGGGR